MTAFATSSDLAILMGKTFTLTEAAQADLVLDLASTAIRTYCRQKIDRVTNETIKLQGTRRAELPLPERPVVSVSQVKLGGILLSDAAWFWDDNEVIRRGSAVFAVNGPDVPGMDYWGWSWGGPEWTVEVTYTHGFSPIPDDIRMVCLSAARRDLETPTGVARETIGSYSVGYERSPASTSARRPVLLSDEEMATLRQGGYRRTWAGAVTV